MVVPAVVVIKGLTGCGALTPATFIAMWVMPAGLPWVVTAALVCTGATLEWRGRQ